VIHTPRVVEVNALCGEESEEFYNDLEEEEVAVVINLSTYNSDRVTLPT
jgi:hypothetical protein